MTKCRWNKNIPSKVVCWLARYKFKSNHLQCKLIWKYLVKSTHPRSNNVENVNFLKGNIGLIRFWMLCTLSTQFQPPTQANHRGKKHSVNKQSGNNDQQ